MPWGEESHPFLVLFPNREHLEEEGVLRKQSWEPEAGCWHLVEGPGSKERR